MALPTSRATPGPRASTVATFIITRFLNAARAALTFAHGAGGETGAGFTPLVCSLNQVQYPITGYAYRAAARTGLIPNLMHSFRSGGAGILACLQPLPEAGKNACPTKGN